MTKIAAFTLIEMLVALCISSIVFAFVLLPVRQFQIQSMDRLMQNKLQDALIFALEAANNYQDQIKLCSSEKHQRCDSTWRGDLIILRRNTLLHVIPFKMQKQDRLYWRVAGNYQSYLIFDGADASNLYQVHNGTFWYCRAPQTNPAWAIFFNRLGQYHLVYPDAQGYIKDSHGKPLYCYQQFSA